MSSSLKAVNQVLEHRRRVAGSRTITEWRWQSKSCRSNYSLKLAATGRGTPSTNAATAATTQSVTSARSPYCWVLRCIALLIRCPFQKDKSRCLRDLDIGHPVFAGIVVSLSEAQRRTNRDDQYTKTFFRAQPIGASYYDRRNRSLCWHLRCRNFYLRIHVRGTATSAHGRV